MSSSVHELIEQGLLILGEGVFIEACVVIVRPEEQRRSAPRGRHWLGHEDS